MGSDHMGFLHLLKTVIEKKSHFIFVCQETIGEWPLKVEVDMSVFKIDSCIIFDP